MQTNFEAKEIKKAIKTLDKYYLRAQLYKTLNKENFSKRLTLWEKFKQYFK